ncbi:MAG: hypothetical protein ABJL44_10605 [Algibacter sp.]
MGKQIKVKSTLAFFIIFGIYSVSAQNYLNNFKSDICQCLEEKQLTVNSIGSEYNKCFTRHLVSYAPLIDTSIDIEDKNLKYLEGQKIRSNLSLKFKYELMYSCDTYFYAFERGIYKLKEKSKQLGDSVKLQKMHELVAMQPHWHSYASRAKEYYNLNDLRKAEQDALKSIELSPYGTNVLQIRPQRLFLSQVYEDQKRYDEAIKLYDGIILGDIDYKTKMLKAIVVRKKNGNYDPPTIDTIEKATNTRQESGSNSQPKGNVKVPPSTTPKIDGTRRRGARDMRTVTIQKDSTKTKTPKAIKSKDSTKKSLRSLFKLD